MLCRDGIKLSAPGVPRSLYSPYPFGDKTVGTWCVSHYEDIRRVYEDNDYFSTKGVAQFQGAGGRDLPVDPARYRSARSRPVSPLPQRPFHPVALQKLEPKARALAVEMIEEFAAKGEVDIAHDFGRVYPVRVFLDLMGLPLAMFEQFLAWEYEILHSRDHARMGAAVKQVIAYLREFIASRRR